MRTLVLTSTIALLGLGSTAQAHFVLTSPPPSNPADSVPKTVQAQVGSNEASGKGGVPCGPDMTPAATPTAAQGGHPLVLKVVEVVPHDGFYRVALSLHSRSELPPDNVVHDASGKVLPSSGIGPDGKTLTGSANSAVTEMPAVFPVLADNLFLHPNPNGAAPTPPTYTQNIMLPNVNCDSCTLQVIEFMHPHPYNGTPGKNDGGGYFYHHCADLKITADPALPMFVPPGADAGATDAASDGSGAAGSGMAGGSGGAAGSGAAGTAGVGGAGTAGATGTGGSLGAAGAGSTGTAGSGTAGTPAGGGGAGAGSTGAAGSRSSGGCDFSTSGTANGLAVLGMALLVFLSSRRRRFKQ
ncbi:MAG TPA: SCE4755 family polysaccharide monooxygenase-like protein [Polyangia bacterium]